MELLQRQVKGQGESLALISATLWMGGQNYLIDIGAGLDATAVTTIVEASSPQPEPSLPEPPQPPEER